MVRKKKQSKKADMCVRSGMHYYIQRQLLLNMPDPNWHWVVFGIILAIYRNQFCKWQRWVLSWQCSCKIILKYCFPIMSQDFNPSLVLNHNITAKYSEESFNSNTNQRSNFSTRLQDNFIIKLYMFHILLVCHSNPHTWHPLVRNDNWHCD